jgi:prepilin-type N-terminal cleavage/methylation domain-containing protein
MRAFTLIETIITIVIVGIVALSFPLILFQTSNNLLVATQQEAILAGKTYIGTIASYQWDGNMSAGDIIILDTNGTAADGEFDRVLGANIRVGNVDGFGRRRLAANITYPTAKGSAEWGNTTATVDDIDDFDGRAQSLSVAASDMDYIFDLNLTSAISYVSDSADYTTDAVDFEFNTGSIAGRTNIKMIQVDVKDATGDTDVNITLRAYSANIGEFDLLERYEGSW